MSKKKPVKQVKKVRNPYTGNMLMYGVITVLSVVLFLLARNGALVILNFPNVYLICLATFGYALTNAVGQYRDFNKYRALYPAKVYDRKSYEEFMTQANYTKEIRNRLGE